MLINDRVYGSVDINEPVLVELIHSSPLQRLHHINQSGPSKFLYPWKNVSRFEHSLGVMLLLHQFKASLSEQIAGLLHDVSHTAFSHVADFVYPNVEHEFHERFFIPVLNQSEIPQILAKYHMSLNVVHSEKYRLLDKPLPDLCADRIDYALRDYLACTGDVDSIKAKLAALTIYRHDFVFNYLLAAEAFAIDYLEFDRQVWADPREIAMYQLMAQAIQHALDKKYICGADLFGDDDMVFDLLKTKGDSFVRKKLDYLRPSFRIEMANQRHYHLFIKTKVRAVNPKVKIGTKVNRLSEISPRFKKLIEQHIKQNSRGWYVNVYKI